MTTPLISTLNDDLLAEIEKAANGLEWTGHWYDAGCGTTSCDYRSTDPNQDHGEVAHPEPVGVSSYLPLVQPANVLALIARVRDLQRWKSEQLKVMGPVLDYAQGLQIAVLGTSCTKALIEDHKRLRKLEEAQRWRDSYDRSERPGPDVKQILVPTEDQGIQVAPASCWHVYTNWLPAPDFPSDFWGEDDADHPL